MSKKKHNRYNFVHNENKNIEQVSNHIVESEEMEEIPIETFAEEDYMDWKKVEIEVLRDRDGNCICIGSREFINKEISVVPLLTIPNKAFQLIRSDSIKTATDLKCIGNLNLKFAVNPTNFEYRLLKYHVNLDHTLIETATKYPMERVITRVNAGELLYNIVIDGNNICYEPVLEDVILDINNRYTVYGNNLEECIIKASCLSKGLGECFRLEELIELEKNDLEIHLKNNNAEVFFMIAEAIRKEISVEKICEITKIDKYFVGSVYKIVKIEKELALNYMNYKLLAKAMNIGLSINTIAFLSGKEEKDLQRIISKNSI